MPSTLSLAEHCVVQTFGRLRAADEIIDEGHFIGKALGEGMNGYRPIVELMNSNFGICAYLWHHAMPCHVTH
jgi:pyruvate/2-oxoglutarate/acetoin dehydrogenase E1 component